MCAPLTVGDDGAGDTALTVGRQPFGLASPAAFLEAAGFQVDCLDLSVRKLDLERARRTDLIAFYLPMHTVVLERVSLDEGTGEVPPEGVSPPNRP